MPNYSEDQIRGYAHSLWEKAGRPDGRHVEFWHQAKSELEVDEPGNEPLPTEENPKPMPE